jgi:hypothetical protein
MEDLVDTKSQNIQGGLINGVDSAVGGQSDNDV